MAEPKKSKDMKKLKKSSDRISRSGLLCKISRNCQVKERQLRIVRR